MIQSFGDKATKDLYRGIRSAAARRLPTQIVATALRKLDYLNHATSLNDLRSPPGNHLEALAGNLAGYHSIRINEQWRIVFRWDAGAHDVRIADYH